MTRTTSPRPTSLDDAPTTQELQGLACPFCPTIVERTLLLDEAAQMTAFETHLDDHFLAGTATLVEVVDAAQAEIRERRR